MKKISNQGFRMLAVSTLVLAGMVTVASAQQTTQFEKVKIGFDFYAGSKLMPAGDYIVKLGPADQSHKIVQIQQIKGNETAILMTVPNTNKRNLKPGAVSFNKYGNQYYLAGVQLGDVSTFHTVIKSKSEKRVLKGIAKSNDNARPETVTTSGSGQ